MAIGPFDGLRIKEPGEPSDRDRLREQEQAAAGFAGQAQQGFQQRGDDLNMAMERMRAIADGRVSYSGEQLRQGLMQNMAQQQAMAAGARGGNQLAMARQASMNAANAGSGLAGQQALAGIRERQEAANALLGAQGQARGQDLQAALGSRGQAIGAAGTQFGNPEQGTDWGKYLGAGVGALQMLGVSDKRAKEDIDDGDDDAREFLRALKAYSYDYKDSSHGKGRQLGVMAQDVEATKFGEQIVVNSPDGIKRLDISKLAGALAATSANLNKRVEDLEGK